MILVVCRIRYLPIQLTLLNWIEAAIQMLEMSENRGMVIKFLVKPEDRMSLSPVLVFYVCWMVSELNHAVNDFENIEGPFSNVIDACL